MRWLSRRRWFEVFVGGAVLFFASEQALGLTGNPNFFPTVILLGAFVAPVAFVAYFYGQERVMDFDQHGASPLMMVVACFLIGGVVGLLVAGVLEYATLQSLSIGSLLVVALIEEPAKLIFPVVVFAAWRYRSRIDGVLVGTAAGMGFAALETMGYGLVAVIQSHGSVTVLEETLLVRGLFSPLGHASWTGLVCAAMWQERVEKGHLGLKTVAAFFAAVALHFLWDFFGGLNQPVVVYAAYAVIGGLSLFLLLRKYRQAKRAVLSSPVPAPLG